MSAKGHKRDELSAPVDEMWARLNAWIAESREKGVSDEVIQGLLLQKWDEVRAPFEVRLVERVERALADTGNPTLGGA